MMVFSNVLDSGVFLIISAKTICRNYGLIEVCHYCHKGQEVNQGGGKSNPPPLQCKWRGQLAAAYRDLTFKVFEFYYSHSLYSSHKTGVSFVSMILVLKRFEKVFDNLICSDCLFFLLIDFRRFSFKKVFELLELIWIESFLKGMKSRKYFSVEILL